MRPPQIAEPARPECRLAPMRPRRAGGMILAHLGKAAGQPHPRDPAKKIMQKFCGTDATSVHAISAGCMCEVRQPPKPYEGAGPSGGRAPHLCRHPAGPGLFGVPNARPVAERCSGASKIPAGRTGGRGPPAAGVRCALCYGAFRSCRTARGSRRAFPPAGERILPVAGRTDRRGKVRQAGHPLPCRMPLMVWCAPAPSRLPPVHEAVPDGAARPVGLRNACSLYCHAGAAGPSACMAVRCHAVPLAGQTGPGPCASLVAPGGGIQAI